MKLKNSLLEKAAKSRKSKYFNKKKNIKYISFADFLQEASGNFTFFRKNYDFMLFNAFVTQYSDNILCVCVFFAVFFVLAHKLPRQYAFMQLRNCGVVHCGSGLNVVIYVYALYVL